LPAYDPCCYHAQFQEVCYQKHTNLRLQWPSGQCETERRLRSLLFWFKDMSACVIYSTQFQQVVIRSIPISDAVAGERHGLCESALYRPFTAVKATVLDVREKRVLQTVSSAVFALEPRDTEHGINALQ
jgi:hypothetical protein